MNLSGMRKKGFWEELGGVAMLRIQCIHTLNSQLKIIQYLKYLYQGESLHILYFISTLVDSFRSFNITSLLDL